MDKVIKVAAGLLLVILVVFIGQGWYSNYVEQKYRNTLESTYSYTCTISTNEDLTNVTFIIPVPTNGTGDSQITERYSDRQISGLPSDWTTTLLSSNKGTMIKITAPVLTRSSTTLTLNVPVKGPINTKSPLATGVLYRPILDLKNTKCPATAGSGASCYQYTSSVYATYDSSPGAQVSIRTIISGKNEWNIFGPASNAYSNSISVSITGEHRRWIETRAEIETGIGSYDVPEI